MEGGAAAAAHSAASAGTGAEASAASPAAGPWKLFVILPYRPGPSGELERDEQRINASTRQRPCHFLGGMGRGEDAEHVMAMTVPDSARDARVRAVFDTPQAAAVVAQLRACVALRGGEPAASAVEDFLRHGFLCQEGLMPRTFRRVAFKSENLGLPDVNALNNFDSGDDYFVINGWAAAKAGKEADGSLPSLNGSAQVHALVLTGFFEGAMPRGQSLMLKTLLAAEALDETLVARAVHGTAHNVVAVRSDHTATCVALDGHTRTGAQLAAASAEARAALARVRDSQLLSALLRCTVESWAGGFLFLSRFAAPLCDAPMRAALEAFALALLRARDGHLHPVLPQSMGLPPLPDAECALCLTPCGAGQRKVCAGCHAVCYHSVECQRAHWHLHKPACKPLTTQAAAMKIFRHTAD